MKWQVEYKVRIWQNVGELEKQLNEMTNQEDPVKGKWRVDTHRVSEGPNGWTLYMRSWETAPAMMSFNFPASVVWDAMNSKEMFELVGNYDDERRKPIQLIDRKIREYYNKNYKGDK